MEQIRALQRDPTPQNSQIPAVSEVSPMRIEATQRFLSEMMDAMQRGDMEAINRIGKQEEAFRASLGSDAALEPLYAQIREILEQSKRPDFTPPTPGGEGAWQSNPEAAKAIIRSQALQNF
jgi:hypothetical protein